MTDDIRDKVRKALFEPTEDDVSYNLQGALHDLTHKFDPHDGGVCARTIERVVKQLEEVRKLTR